MYLYWAFSLSSIYGVESPIYNTLRSGRKQSNCRRRNPEFWLVRLLWVIGYVIRNISNISYLRMAIQKLLLSHCLISVLQSFHIRYYILTSTILGLKNIIDFCYIWVILQLYRCWKGDQRWRKVKNIFKFTRRSFISEDTCPM